MTRNLGEFVLHAAQAYGDDVAFQVRRGFRLERLTFRQAGQRTRQVAGWLAGKGLTLGDRLVVWAPNMPEYAVLYFGAWLAGVVVVPVDVRTRPDVLNRFVATAGARLGFKSRYMEGTFGPPVAETFALEELFDLVAAAPPAAGPPEVGPDSLCEIAFTSGTTGVPKGVMLTHGNLLAELEGLRVAFPLQRSYRALSVLPLSHALEQVINLLLTFSFGVRVSYVPRVSAVSIARTLREDSITCFILVPELLRLLLAGIERRAREAGQWGRWQRAQRLAGRLPFRLRRLLFRQVHQALGGHLQFVGCGGAPLDLKLAATWERMGLRVFEGYGLTETSAAATINNWRAARLGTVGKPIPGVEVKIAADGEVLIRGKTVGPGYFGNPGLTTRSFVDGWFRSGDVGALDAGGFLRISGREAFKIVPAHGRNVYPEDIEHVLNQHPLVEESCVVGIERNGGETVHAVLITAAPERAAEIIRETNRQLADHQQIAGYTVWSEPDLPRTPILKVDRRLVRAAVERQQTTAAAVRPAGAAAHPPDGLPVNGRPVERGAAADPLPALVARLAGRPAGDARDSAELGTDLGLDSIGRIELLAAIEEEMGLVIDEAKLGPQTTVGELRRLAAEGQAGGAGAAPARWPRSWWARALRPLLQAIAFRLQDRWLDIEVVHPERATHLPLPSILIFNYQGPYVPLLMLRALPPRLRARVAVAADSRLWEGRDRWQGLLGALAIQAFPFVKSGGAVRPSLEELGRWLDDGYAAIMSPEGNPEVDGQMLPFLGGTGLMAVEMGVPVIPFKVEDYYRLFPKELAFPFLPDKRGRVRLIVGEPVTFPKTTPHRHATERLEQAMRETR